MWGCFDCAAPVQVDGRPASLIRVDFELDHGGFPPWDSLTCNVKVSDAQAGSAAGGWTDGAWNVRWYVSFMLKLVGAAVVVAAAVVIGVRAVDRWYNRAERRTVNVLAGQGNKNPE